MWRALQKQLAQRKVLYQRIEDRVSKGIPDLIVEADDGSMLWVELKWSNNIAVPPNRKVQRLPHFTIEQKSFLTEWWNTAVVWKIGREWFVFSDHYDKLGRVTYMELTTLCEFSGSVNDVAEWLKGGHF